MNRSKKILTMALSQRDKEILESLQPDVPGYEKKPTTYEERNIALKDVTKLQKQTTCADAESPKRDRHSTEDVIPIGSEQPFKSIEPSLPVSTVRISCLQSLVPYSDSEDESDECFLHNKDSHALHNANTEPSDVLRDRNSTQHTYSEFKLLKASSSFEFINYNDTIDKFRSPDVEDFPLTQTNLSNNDLVPVARIIKESNDICDNHYLTQTSNEEDFFNVRTSCQEKINDVPDENSTTSEEYNTDKDPEYNPFNDYASSKSDELSLEDGATNEERLEELMEIQDAPSILTDKIDRNNTFGIMTKHIKRSRNKDFCFYCEDWVCSFARHVIRNHTNEIDVQEIISKAPRDLERKKLLSILRKKGNYLGHNTGVIRHVRKPVLLITKPLPCTFCLGFYSRKQLWRHRKKCSLNPGITSTQSSQSAGLSLLTKNCKGNRFLRENIFPRMRADHISLTAQKDTLICEYGTRFLLTHRQDHQRIVCSRKMRELGRMLIRVKQLNKNIRNLIEALKPQHFDVLVEAARIESGHDVKTDDYNSPTFGMNIGTSLKECCELGITIAMKQKHSMGGREAEDLEDQLKTTILLIKSNWNAEVSHQAANCLHTKKMNNITIVPLASDIRKFRDFLVEQGECSADTLKKNSDDKRAFITLTSTLYCRVLLLCRKRVGELQRLPLDLYERSGEKTTYEEFVDVVKPAEMLLMKKFKRVVIQGKRKVTPVLFSFDVQEHISVLLSLRNRFVGPNNPYLFAAANSDNPIVGYKILQVQAKKAGLQNADAFTSRRLRKHLATISQLFHMTDNDIEQLSTFMGHTSGIHRQEYRLPDEVYQTATLAKLLLAMEKGEGSKYKGKTLDEIDLEEEIADDSDESEGDIDDGNAVIEDFISSEPSTSLPVIRVKSKLGSIRKAKRNVTKWTSEEKTVVAEFFKKHIQQSKPPRKKECEEVMMKNQDLFKNLTWVKIKVFVQNLYTKKTRI